MNHLVQRAALAAAGVALSGCASFSPDGGRDAVAQMTRERVGVAAAPVGTAAQAAAAQGRVAELLRQPLSADAAVEIALLNNRALQAVQAELGIAEADRVRAGRLANPSIGFGRLSGHGAVEIDRSVMFDVIGLFTLPLAREIGQGRFEQAQLRAAFEAVSVASQARKAYFDAVAAQQLLGYQAQMMEAAQASSELARQMHAVGNANALAQLREQAFQADVALLQAKAQHRAVAARERLVRALGLDGDLPAPQLPDRLPDLPVAPVEPRDAERTAIDRRLDVLMAKRHADATARSLGLSRATRFINVLEAGYQNRSESAEGLARGYEIRLELPLFDFGEARTRRAESTYLQAVHRAAAVGVNARSEVREAYSAYRTAFEAARRYRDEVVPLHRRISEENLLRYNGMLASVFELLADAREQIAAVAGAVDALRDHWLAETDLQTALTGRSPGASALADQ